MDDKDFRFVCQEHADEVVHVFGTEGCGIPCDVCGKPAVVSGFPKVTTDDAASV